MKKTIFILVIAIVIIFSAIAFYFIKKELNYPPKTKISNCCGNNIVCNEPGEQPTCMEINLATGEKYPEPKCICLNPNMEY